MEDFPCVAERLSSDASIIHNPVFEIGIVKIMDRQSVNITVEERTATHCFIAPQVTNAGHTDSTELSLAQRA